MIQQGARNHLVEPIQLGALLFWEAIEKLPDPMVRLFPPVDAPSQLAVFSGDLLGKYPHPLSARGGPGREVPSRASCKADTRRWL